MTLSEKIRVLRENKHMTLVDVASAVGVSAATVSKWENGVIENMRRDKLVNLASVLGATTEYLLSEEDPATGADVPGVASRVVKKPEAPQKKKTALDEVIDKLTVIRDSIPSDLRPDEQQFLRDYRMLNNTQRTQLRLYMDALLDARLSKL